MEAASVFQLFFPCSQLILKPEISMVFTFQYKSQKIFIEDVAYLKLLKADMIMTQCVVTEWEPLLLVVSETSVFIEWKIWYRLWQHLQLHSTLKLHKHQDARQLLSDWY